MNLSITYYHPGQAKCQAKYERAHGSVSIFIRTMGEFQCSMTARYNGYMSAQTERHKVNEVEGANQEKEGPHEFGCPFKKRNFDHEPSECRILLSRYWRIPCIKE